MRPSSAACASQFSWRGGGLRPPAVANLFDERFTAPDANAFDIAILVAMSGLSGLWAPSCIACAQLAEDELNRGAGIDGRPVRLTLIDAAVESGAALDDTVDALIDAEAVDAVVGMHISAVRQRLLKTVRGRVPYIYTPLYEGGERAPGVFTIGETPDRQVGPAIDWLDHVYRPRKWAFVGNDYVWPRRSNAFARRKVASLGGELVHERYLPFGAASLEEEVDRVARSGADAVLLSLIGQDAVDFNRAFAAADLHRRMIRFSCVIDENVLLACGETGQGRLFSSASYFGNLATPENRAFKERYHSLHGDRAPTLNAMGQSLYEGLHFLASLMAAGSDGWSLSRRSRRGPISYRSARRAVYGSNGHNGAPVYLARAEGASFEVMTQIAAASPMARDT